MDASKERNDFFYVLSIDNLWDSESESDCLINKNSISFPLKRIFIKDFKNKYRGGIIDHLFCMKGIWEKKISFSKTWIRTKREKLEIKIFFFLKEYFFSLFPLCFLRFGRRFFASENEEEEKEEQKIVNHFIAGQEEQGQVSRYRMRPSVEFRALKR